MVLQYCLLWVLEYGFYFLMIAIPPLVLIFVF